MNIEGVASLLFVIPLLLIPFVLIYSVIWSYFDAEERGKPGCLVALLVLLFSWPVGLLLWLIFRPERTRSS